MNLRSKTTHHHEHHVVHFANEPQRILIEREPLLPDKNCFAYVTGFMYNAAEKTILGKTKEKWLFILLGLIVAFLVIFLVINLVQRTAEASASEFTYTRRNGTGEYYVIKRKLSPETTSPNQLL